MDKDIKTYILTFEEYNTNNQTAITQMAFKAKDLKELEGVLREYENDCDSWPNERIIEHSFEGPDDFFDAGGFCSREISFVCEETKEDLLHWYKTHWGDTN